MQLGHRVGLKRPTKDVTETLALDLNCNAAMVSQTLPPLDDAVPTIHPRVSRDQY